MSEEERDYEEDCKLNKFKLDDASEEQADLYRYWAEQLAEAKTDVDKAKQKLDLVTAKENLKVRGAGEIPGGIKLTEGSISSYLLTLPEIQKAQDNYIEAKKEAMLLEAAKGGMEHRKSQIANLKDLYISGYFADPDRNDKTSEMTEKARTGLNKKHKK